MPIKEVKYLHFLNKKHKPTVCGHNVKIKVKQSLTGTEGSRRLRLPNIKTIGT
jgi:hypothetical protein